MTKSKHRNFVNGVLFFFLFKIVEKLLSQSGTNYSIKKSVTDQGGNSSQSANHQVKDAVGQPSPVSVTSSANYSISSGFFGSSKYIVNVLEEADLQAIPEEFKLLQNYPNPFNPETTIEFQLPQPSEVSLTIYDVSGHQVQQMFPGSKSAGQHRVQWDGRDDSGKTVASGIYFYRIKVKAKDGNQQTFSDVRKMIFIK